MIYAIAFLFCLLCASAFFSASETSLFSLPHIRVRTYAHSKERRKQLLARLLSNPQDLIVTLLMLNIFTNLCLQNVFANYFESLSNAILNIAVPLFLTLVFGEIIPKAIAFSHNDRLARFVSPYIAAFYHALSPVRKIFTSVTSRLSRCLFFFLHPEKAISQEELSHVIDQSEYYGLLSQRESALIESCLSLQKLSIKEVMQPREQIIAYDITQPLSLLHALLQKQRCPVILVHRGDIDQPLGLLSLSELVKASTAITCPKDLEPLLEPLDFVPENASANVLLQHYQGQKTFLALVVDEYATVSGVVMESDLMEILLGKPYRINSNHLFYLSPQSDALIANGKLDLADLEKMLSVKLPNPSRLVTLNGWLIQQLGDIPSPDSTFVLHSLMFYVIEANAKQVCKVYVKIKKAEAC